MRVNARPYTGTRTPPAEHCNISPSCEFCAARGPESNESHQATSVRKQSWPSIAKAIVPITPACPATPPHAPSPPEIWKRFSCPVAGCSASRFATRASRFCGGWKAWRPLPSRAARRASRCFIPGRTGWPARDIRPRDATCGSIRHRPCSISMKTGCRSTACPGRNSPGKWQTSGHIASRRGSIGRAANYWQSSPFGTGWKSRPRSAPTA